MPAFRSAEPRHRELRSDDGSLRVELSAEGHLSAELAGVVSLAHAQALSAFSDACIDVAPVNLSLFQDLSRVTAVAFEAQAHLASWARERAPCLDRLHFLVHDERLVALIRTMFMALPVRAYLYRQRASFDAARARVE